MTIHGVPVLLTQLAMARSSLGDWDEAIRVLRQAINFWQLSGTLPKEKGIRNMAHGAVEYMFLRQPHYLCVLH